METGPRWIEFVKYGWNGARRTSGKQQSFVLTAAHSSLSGPPGVAMETDCSQLIRRMGADQGEGRSGIILEKNEDKQEFLGRTDHL
jgi:hypothetical protein